MHNSKNMITVDGNEACAKVAYHFTDVAAIYPITPSSPMAEKTDEWSANGKLNMFGQRVKLVEMQSEAGAAGAIHGASEAGGLATTFTSSQGLLLMIPNLHILAGHRMPSVFHVAARSVAQHANNIFGDHQDVMDCRATGSIMMSTSSVQEVMDLAAIAHFTTLDIKFPFIHFFDGFRTSHEIQKIEEIDFKELEKLFNKDSYLDFQASSMNPQHPIVRTTVQGPEVYFQQREANNLDYAKVPDIVEEYMHGINKITGRDYQIFNYYGDENAERLVVTMGSASETVKEVVDRLIKEGEKVALLQIHLYRPFDVKRFVEKIPQSVKKITVMDRSIEPGAIAGPVYLDVVAALNEVGNDAEVYACRYGIASKDVNPGQIEAIYKNMEEESPKKYFSIGIKDDVTNQSLDYNQYYVTSNDDVVECKIWGLGGDGTVGANKNSAKIVGDHTETFTQAYFEYDSKKSLGITKSNLRFSKNPIRSTYVVKNANFVACHEQSYIYRYDMLDDLKEGGTFLLNSTCTNDEIYDKLPKELIKQVTDKNIDFYVINAKEIARELGLGNRTNIILQGAFFKLTNLLPEEEARKYIEESIKKTYGKKGEEVVNKNIKAIDYGFTKLSKLEFNESMLQGEDVDAEVGDFQDIIFDYCSRQKGDDLPVSVFMDHQDGSYNTGSSKKDKRGLATAIPKWDPEKCIQCNRCAFVCPHASIRSFILDNEEEANKPEDFVTTDLKGKAEYKYSIQVSNLNCTGCGLCVNECPAKEKAINMTTVTEVNKDTTNWDYAMNLKDKKDVFKRFSLKGSQFSQPLLEFSGACAGCGETPYAKLLTQLYGEKMFWINAVGCSLAWGADFPSIPYTVNKDGHGPAFYGTLFEDTAENGLGMALSIEQKREYVKERVEELKEVAGEKLKEACSEWLDTYEDLDENPKKAESLIAAMEEGTTEENKALINDIMERKDMLSKKVVWIYGGDGWAYDIGFGGLDHLIASGEDINIMIVDTEVYSNTGGQSSKATPIGATAKFAVSGKNTKKKDLGRMLMTYEKAYVASVSMGSNPNQLINAIDEAVKFKGPSVILCYAPCINHGLKQGMCKSHQAMRDVVSTGLWPLYRFNPTLDKPFKLDYKKPTMEVKDYFMTEVRYSSLALKYPQKAEELFAIAQEDVDKRFETYTKLEKFYNNEL